MITPTIAILTINNSQQAGGTQFHLLFTFANNFAKKVTLLTIDWVSSSKSVLETGDRAIYTRYYKGYDESDRCEINHCLPGESDSLG
jgi:hypothetical protein